MRSPDLELLRGTRARAPAEYPRHLGQVHQAPGGRARLAAGRPGGAGRSGVRLAGRGAGGVFAGVWRAEGAGEEAAGAGWETHGCGERGGSQRGGGAGDIKALIAIFAPRFG
jgi:hypothetical protein